MLDRSVLNTYWLTGVDKVSGGCIWNQVEICSGMGMDFERLLIIMKRELSDQLH